MGYDVNILPLAVFILLGILFFQAVKCKGTPKKEAIIGLSVIIFLYFLISYLVGGPSSANKIMSEVMTKAGESAVTVVGELGGYK